MNFTSLLEYASIVWNSWLCSFHTFTRPSLTALANPSGCPISLRMDFPLQHEKRSSVTGVSRARQMEETIQL
jgi:hypothetical protein